MILTDTQKLLRLRHIERLIEQEGPEHPNHPCHLAERAKLLSGIGLPPESLMRVVDPHAWAEKFGELFRHPDPSTTLAWFDGAQGAAYDAGRNQGRIDGRAEAQDNVQQLVKALRLTHVMLKTGRAKADIPRDDNNPDAPPQTLQMVIEKALLPFEG